MKKQNRLAKETSPYLLQHSYNPVDWFTWGDEAFEIAEKENKPVFISIGYSTCHWCHVMGHESFEDEEIASILNNSFISIKVDREEYPDVDHFYMEACQQIAGRGGWPLSIFTDKSRKPFYAGTYFPKNSLNGITGFKEVLNKIVEVWHTNPDAIQENITQIGQSLAKQSALNSSSKFADSIFKNAFRYFKNSFDKKNGGFGDAPKFPAPQNLLFLLRYWYHYKDETALQIVETTVRHICSGGIFDHIGFGFHRYSTDSNWLVPHFEKMLYDQAMLILVLNDLYKITKSEFYKYYLENTAEFVLTEMLSPEGGFYSAYDADSEGVEGRYYVWSYKELVSILSGDEVLVLEKYYGLSKSGNFRAEHSTFEEGDTILNFNLEYMDEFVSITNQFASIREKIFRRRNKRIPPLLDNKILTDWNGLMIYALSSTAFTLDNTKYLDASKKAFSFITKNHFKGDKIYHSSAAGKINYNSILDDYAFTGLAGTKLFEISEDAEYLEISIKLAKLISEKFYDREKHLFKLSESFFKEESFSIFDNAYPSGNSTAFLFFSRLFHITKNEEFQSVITPIYENIPDILNQYPFGATFFLQTLFNLNFNFREVIIVHASLNDLSIIINGIRGSYEPDKALLLINSANIDQLERINEFFSSFIPYLQQEDELPLIFICDKEGCSLPGQLK